jgi:hypothetical protein
MERFKGIIASINRTGAGNTGGILGNTTRTVGATLFSSLSNSSMWDHGTFGLSVTTIGTQAFNAYVVFPGHLSTTNIPIAGWSGIATTTSILLPIVNEISIGVVAGTTQFSFIGGIPTPTAVIFGNSGTPGQSYSAVVYAELSRTRR